MMNKTFHFIKSYLVFSEIQTMLSKFIIPLLLMTIHSLSHGSLSSLLFLSSSSSSDFSRNLIILQVNAFNPSKSLVG